MAYEWTDMSYLELLAGNTAMIIFGFAVVMVFLVLAAQYESWSLPLAVILVVPMCLLSAITGVNIADMDINIFTQIGFVVLVGLASKNAILIVEFAKVQRQRGKSRAGGDARGVQAAAAADRHDVVRLHPGRGAADRFARGRGRNAADAGTAVFSGMLGVTLFGIVLTPVFFFTIDWLGETQLFHLLVVRRVAGFALDAISMRPLRRLLPVPSAMRVAVNGEVSRHLTPHPHPRSPKGRAENGPLPRPSGETGWGEG